MLVILYTKMSKGVHIMKFMKCRDVKSPARAHNTDGGIDFFIPNDFEPVTLRVGDHIKIPSGVKVIVPEGYALVAFNKSGVALNKGLDVSATVVDIGYTGEMNLCFNKVSGDPVTLNPGDKIVQFLLLKLGFENTEEISEEEYINLTQNSERGEGGFGSSGTK